MTCVVKFSHLEQTLFVHSHPMFYSLQRCLELFLWRKEKYHIMECCLVWKPADRLPFRRQEKSRNDECPNVCCAHSLPHCFNVTFLKISQLFSVAPSVTDGI